jgi:hypothetical protein
MISGIWKETSQEPTIDDCARYLPLNRPAGVPPGPALSPEAHLLFKEAAEVDVAKRWEPDIGRELLPLYVCGRSSQCWRG